MVTGFRNGRAHQAMAGVKVVPDQVRGFSRRGQARVRVLDEVFDPNR